METFFLSEPKIFIAYFELVPSIEHPLMLMEFPHRGDMQKCDREHASACSQLLGNGSEPRKITETLAGGVTALPRD